MLSFKELSWNEADRITTQESKKADQLQAQLKVSDYCECYCLALNNPPWGGYSIEEQVLHEIQYRKNLDGRAGPQDIRTSRYSYVYVNNSLTGEVVVHEPFIDELFSASNARSKCEPANEPSDKVLDTTTSMLENVRISNPGKTRKPTPPFEELPKEILHQIFRNLNPFDLECLSEASRRLTTVIGLVPCPDAFTWAVHHCHIHGHTRDASLCGDCVLAFDKRIENSFCQGKHLYRRAKR